MVRSSMNSIIPADANPVNDSNNIEARQQMKFRIGSIVIFSLTDKRSKLSHAHNISITHKIFDWNSALIHRFEHHFVMSS